jgi:hypothetical protein
MNPHQAKKVDIKVSRYLEVANIPCISWAAAMDLGHKYLGNVTIC